MSRPAKRGLEYFSHDVNLSSDDKIQFIEANHGITGYGVYCKLLEKIYKNGYYIKWEPRDEILFSKTIGLDASLVKKIITDCIEEKLFSPELYMRFGILTSRAVQERFLMGAVKRKNIEFIQDYLCIHDYEFFGSVKVTLTTVNGEKTGVISPETPQSKVKESKEKKSSVSAERTHDFKSLLEYMKTLNDFEKLKDYDLEYYFNRVVNYYPQKNFSAEELKAKIIFFIENDKNSVKHEPKKSPKPKPDCAAIAFEFVKENLDWIKKQPDKNPMEIVPELMKRCKNSAKNNPLFECYLEKGLEYYRGIGIK
ncbi:MAG: DUF4373 domain-containing protein [Bacteroidetes bacterium]|nr:DUF4373 domain-containing protein [Bacteroidota bacterium]